MQYPKHRFLILWHLQGLSGIVWAHPLPDIPITTPFEKGGEYSIHAVVDPRCFEADPTMAPFLLNKDLAIMSQEKQAELKAKVKRLLSETVTFHFNPSGEVKAAFNFSFGSVESHPLLLPDDPVMVFADWKAPLPTNALQYQIRTAPQGGFSVLFVNKILGRKIERFQILFPGEESFKIDLQPLFLPDSFLRLEAQASKAPLGTYRVLGYSLCIVILSILAFKRRFS